MDEDLASGLRLVAGQLVVAVAALHLAYALPRLPLYSPTALASYRRAGIVPPPRPALFLALGALLLGGLLATRRGLLDRRTAYLGGIALMAASLLSWVVWHTALDHGAVLVGSSGGSSGDASGHHHGGGLLHTVVDHFLGPLAAVLTQSASSGPGSFKAFLAVVAKLLELGALALFVVLLRADPTLDR